MVQAHVSVRVAVPAQGRSGLDRQATRLVRREHGVAVGRVLAREGLPARHGHHAHGPVVLARQALGGGQRQVNLGPGGDEDAVARPLGWIPQHIGPALDAVLARAGEHRHVLPCGQDRRRTVAGLACHGMAEGARGLTCVGRAYHVQARDETQGHDVLDRLVGGPVFAQEKAVVGKDMEDRQLHQGRQSQAAAHEVGEHEECGVERAHAAVQGQTVGDASHGVLAHPEVDVATGGRIALLAGAVGDPDPVRPGEIGRAADEGGVAPRQGREHARPGLARGHARAGLECGHVREQVGRQLARPQRAQLPGQGRVRLGVGVEPGAPARRGRGPVRAHALGPGGQVLGHVKRRLGPAHGRLGRCDFLGAEPGPVHRRGPRLVGAALADDGAAADERGAGVLGPRLGHGARHVGRVLAVGLRHVPAIGGKARRHVLARVAACGGPHDASSRMVAVGYRTKILSFGQVSLKSPPSPQ